MDYINFINIDRRKLTLEDLEAFRSLRLECLKEFPYAFGSSFEEESEKANEFWINRLEDLTMINLGIFYSNELIGICSISKDDRIKTRHKCDLIRVYVKKTYQGKKIGNMLIDYAIKIAREDKDLEIMNLSVASTNEAAKKLYESFEFVKYGKEIHSAKINDEYFDQDLMFLNL